MYDNRFSHPLFSWQLGTKCNSISGKSGNTKAFSNGTLSDLLKTAQLANIDISVVQPIAVKPQNTPTINAVAYKNNSIGGIISFGSVHPYYENYKDELKK